MSVGEREKADRRKAMPFGYLLFAVAFLAFNYILSYVADRTGNGYLMAIPFCLFLLYFPMVIAYLAIFAVQAVKLKIRSAASTLAGIIVLSVLVFGTNVGKSRVRPVGLLAAPHEQFALPRDNRSKEVTGSRSRAHLL